MSARRLADASSALRTSVSCKDFARSVASWAGELEAGGEPLVCATGSSRGATEAGGGGCGEADIGRDRRRGTGSLAGGAAGAASRAGGGASRTGLAMAGQEGEVKGGRGAGRGHI